MGKQTPQTCCEERGDGAHARGAGINMDNELHPSATANSRQQPKIPLDNLNNP